MNKKYSSVSILKDLVSFDTTTNLSTLCAVSYVEDLFHSYKIAPNIIYKDFEGIRDSNRASVIATIGDPSKPGIILSGHLDTCGIDGNYKFKNYSGEVWETNPWRLTQCADSLYGLGVADMKGGIAVALSKISEFKKIANIMPIHFIFTHDEESEFTAIAQLTQNNFYGKIASNQAACIVMEPMNNEFVNKHRGAIGINIEIIGNTSNSNVPKNRKQAWDIWHNGLFKQFYQEWNAAEDDQIFSLRQVTDGNKTKFVLELFHNQDERGRIETFITVFKNFIKKCNDDMIRAGEDCKIVTAQRTNVAKPFDVSKITNGRVIGQFGETEAGFYQDLGINTIVCGPGEYFNNCHWPNEKISLKQLNGFNLKLSKMINSLIIRGKFQ